MGQIEQLFIRPRRRAPMQSCCSVVVEVGKGIVAEKRHSKRRHVSFIAIEAWQATLQELGVDLPIQTRRANVAVRGVDLAILIGQQIEIGGAIFKIHGETDPCLRMDEAYPGLMNALLPDCRGGVFGEVLVGGQLQVGDAIHLLE